MDSKKRVLIVEDDTAIQSLLSMMLNSHGYDTSLAEHGLKAVELLHKERFDIIICDMMMPFMDGLRFIKWLRDEIEMDLPVIVITSVNNPKIREDILKAGATDIIYKPVVIQELFKRLEDL